METSAETSNVTELFGGAIGEVPTPNGNKEKESDRSVEARWGARLAKSYTAIPAILLSGYWRLRPHENARGLNSTEAMVLIQIASFRWDKRAPFPTMKTLGKRMGLQVRTVRDTIKRLEELGYIRREASAWGGPNRYHFDGLIKALEKLLDEDIAKKEAAEVTGAAAEPPPAAKREVS